MRIASLQPSITLTLHALGQLDHLCAITKYCVEALPEIAARNLPILYDSWTADTTEIVATSPDLVIASVPYRMESLAAILKSGLPILTLAPHNLADIDKDIRLIASVVHAQQAGETLIATMHAAIAEVRTRAASASVQPLIYCEEWGKPLIHSQHWIAELVEAAGGRFLGEPGSHTTPKPSPPLTPTSLSSPGAVQASASPWNASLRNATGTHCHQSKIAASSASPTNTATPLPPPFSKASPA